MIPSDISDEDIRKAVAIIDQEGIPPSRKSVHYDLVLNTRKYPPKYVISVAYRLKTGAEFPSKRFNAVEAKNHFLTRGYDLIDRRTDKLERIASEDFESEFPEGKVNYKLHRKLERDPKIARLAKLKRLEEAGSLECDVCDFNFSDNYGELGTGFIEAHHTTPVSELKGKINTKVSDLALLCSNCHRMIHRGKTLLSIENLKKILDHSGGA